MNSHDVSFTDERRGYVGWGSDCWGTYITNTYYDCAGDWEENTVQHITIGKIPKIPAGDSLMIINVNNSNTSASKTIIILLGPTE